MAAQWHCIISGQEHGPLTAEQLVQLRRANRLTPADLVRKDDSPWVAASMVIGLFPQMEPPPPLERETSDTAVAAPEATNHDSPPVEPSHASTSSNVLENPSAPAGPSPAAIMREIGPGSRLGNYQILDTLGEGGMGVVLKAQHIRMERMVALKVLRSRAVQSTTGVQRFQKEVRAAARLSHPNIVTAYDADEVGGVHFLVMEYVNGASLAELLAHRGRFEIVEAVGYVIQVARGLDYAHSEGVVHRDIKPGNLLLDKRGTVKILDMGLASMKEEAPGDNAPPPQRGGEFVTQENQLLGTFDYMPPEQAEDAHSVDHRADIYSLGCTLFRLVTGRLPYAGDTAIKKILAHRESPIPSICQLRSDAPVALDQVLRRMLAKSPADRQQSMAEVIEELGDCLEGRARPSMMPEMGSTIGDASGYRFASDLPGNSASLRASDSAVYIPVPADDEDSFGDGGLRGNMGLGGIEPVNEDRFYWQVMGQETGPFTRDQLRAKKIPPDDFVRNVYSSQWNRADEIEGLF
jgi:serine/threonine protein kinase